MAKSYPTGYRPTLTFRFKVNGVLTDPTTVTVRELAPGDTTPTDYAYPSAQVQKSAVGVYTYSPELSEEGTWWFQGVGTGTCQAKRPVDIVAQRSPFP